MEKLLKEVRETTKTARDLYYTNQAVNLALYLDLELLELEAELGLMDGMEVGEYASL